MCAPKSELSAAALCRDMTLCFALSCVACTDWCVYVSVMCVKSVLLRNKAGQLYCVNCEMWCIQEKDVVDGKVSGSANIHHYVIAVC